MSGIYTGASAIISNMTKVDLHGNNVANVKTNGYKADKETFRVFDETYRRGDYRTENKILGPYLDEVYTDAAKVDYTEGTFETTESPLDFALHDASDGGISFFQVSKDDKTYLTRNGNFKLDSDRRLSTLNGALATGDDGKPITIPNGSAYSVGADGSISEVGTGNLFGKIKLVSVAKPDLGLLQKRAGAMFEVMDAQTIQSKIGSLPNILNAFDSDPTLQKVFGSKTRIQQIIKDGQPAVAGAFTGELKNYALESSNVDLNGEITGLMSAQRNVNAGQKVEVTFNSILDKEANELAK